MLMTEERLATKLLGMILETLDIPRSLYEKAVARHKSLGEWLCRPESRVAHLEPYVSAQGSFRYGTVIPPLFANEEYDLDNVTRLTLPKTALTQKQIKQLYGEEVKSYAQAHGMAAPVEEKDRCWRLVYADNVSFHLDTLPCLPEEAPIIAGLVSAGVPSHLAERAIAITDRRHPQYEAITNAMYSSNPRGFAAWFEEVVRPFALERLRHLVATRLYAAVEDVPPYEWNTILQQCIKLMKRHRDVMFRYNPDLKPISMIITNLAARAYAGETDLWDALRNLIERMPRYVNAERPRVPNPADPAEDYADKWRRDPRLEENFWLWLAQFKADVDELPRLLEERQLSKAVSRTFSVDINETHVRKLLGGISSAAPAVIRSAPVVQITTPARPWGDCD